MIYDARAPIKKTRPNSQQSDSLPPNLEQTQHPANVTAAQIEVHHVDFVFAAAAVI